MTKKEIFDKIAETCAEVCNVNVEEITGGCKKEDVCTARVLCVFWCDAAGFCVESLLKCCDCNNANSINSVKARIEQMWVEKFAFHMLAAEIGKRLQSFAHSMNEDFDVWLPLRRIAKHTGKYMPPTNL